MYLHLGRDVVVRDEDVVAVLDMDTSTWSRHTRAWLSSAEQAGLVEVITDELPKSVILCRENGHPVVYISQISSKTILKRAEEASDDWSIPG